MKKIVVDKKLALGIAAGVAGFATGAAITLAIKKRFDKIFGEMQDDASEQIFTSPDGNNSVRVLFGASKTAKKMALVSIQAKSEADDCILLALARRGDNLLSGEWSDNNNFELLVGSCSNKQCCNVSFEGGKIVMNYYLKRIVK